MTANHPIQPLVRDEHGTPRFKANAIVRFLLDQGPFDLNDLAGKGFSNEDFEQLAQLIGYSLGGFSELSYVRDETYERAAMMSEGADERDARIEALQTTLECVREGLRQVVPAVFRVHPDDLET